MLNCNEGGERMEVFLYIALLVFAFSTLFEKLTNFMKQLKNSKSDNKLSGGKTIKAGFIIKSSNKKKKRSQVAQDKLHFEQIRKGSV